MLLERHPEFQKLQLTTSETEDIGESNSKPSYTLIVPKSKPKSETQKVMCIKCRMLSPCDCGENVAEL